MDNNSLNHFRELLENKLRDIGGTVQKMTKNEAEEQENYSSNELSSYDNHPADLGSELYMTEMNTALKLHEKNILKDINNALSRIEKGSFGKCAFCGRDISMERLEAMPYARLCIDCQEDTAVDPEILARQRPNEELIWDAPFGRKYLNKREDDEHEGMDQLGDLMKYGSSDSPQDLGGYHDYEEYYTNKIDHQGIVEKMDNISNEYYKKQLPD
ncbi:TraR/DksA family transcriptional regulator [Anaerobacterium chartisolvens]|uniref:TraR/DksA family transcriptional regulator n=1 Tax=Anaerobacterium chartisolvens TaxID=1297424 RepID=A0A369B5P5_9FIRM|nr:TraR/DksA C4-type zinc finger protein [Anaerobacterium chartisolvens]RCX16830.1 TraR/DksA family transcriptional regulator [Anaerobacterium chartisolvens]